MCEACIGSSTKCSICAGANRDPESVDCTCLVGFYEIGEKDCKRNNFNN